ncbi:hypothetical protein ABVT39_006543 [Epinephelus coioides]
MAENNLLTAAATLFTGATYTDIADWAAVLRLQLPKKTTYYNIQSSYLIPVIEEAYKMQENAIFARLICQTLDGEAVHVCGDGRSDSPGHSGKYTTYSFMDDSTNEIILFELIQVTQAKSSVGMEPLGFRKGLERLLDEGIHVTIVTTDRHPSIRKTLRETFPDIDHQFDPWHITKGIKKKLVQASKRKYCKDIGPCIKSITNHLWWCCSTSKGDGEELIRRWKSLLHHIRGVHRWEENGEEHKRYHPDLSADEQRKKRWLLEDSAAFKALYEVVMNRRLLQDLEQMTLFKHTGNLEVFHNALLKYCPKRLHFDYPSMQAHTRLAVMDHNENHNTKREQALTATGLQRHNVVFQKQSKQWVSQPIYKETTQRFRDDLMEQVLHRRLDPSVIFRDSTSKVNVPRLAANIAPFPKPSSPPF